jgi:hypothetical protein
MKKDQYNLAEDMMAILAPEKNKHEDLLSAIDCLNKSAAMLDMIGHNDSSELLTRVMENVLDKIEPK